MAKSSDRDSGAAEAPEAADVSRERQSNRRFVIAVTVLERSVFVEYLKKKNKYIFASFRVRSTATWQVCEGLNFNSWKKKKIQSRLVLAAAASNLMVEPTTLCRFPDRPTTDFGGRREGASVPAAASFEPADYLSVRVTTSHDNWKTLVERVFHDVDYCCYKHGGPGRCREHFHICVPGGNSDRIRKRLKDHLGGGNKVYSVKQFTNPLRSFVFYCEHEGSKPVFEGSTVDWPSIIEAVRVDGVYKKRSEIGFNVSDKEFKPRERDWQLTYSNLVPQAVAFRNKNMPGETSLKAVVKEMIRTTKWTPSPSMLKGGVPKFYYSQFRMRLGLEQDPDMSWFVDREHGVSI